MKKKYYNPHAGKSYTVAYDNACADCDYPCLNRSKLEPRSCPKFKDKEYMERKRIEFLKGKLK